MTSVNLEETLEYVNIQEGLLSKNSECYLFIKEHFDLFFSIWKQIPEVQNNQNHFYHLLYCLWSYTTKHFLC